LRLIFILLIVCNICFGQQDLNQEINSLRDSVLLYRYSDPDKAIDFGFEVIEIADFSNPINTLVGVHSQIGEILYYRGLYADAIGFYNESIKLFEAIPIESRNEKKIFLPPWVLVNIGNIYYINNDFKNATIKYNEALLNFKLFDNIKNKNFGISTVYDNLGSIAELENDFELSIEYYSKAYEIRKKNNKIEDLLISEMHLMTINMSQHNMFNVNKHFIEIEKLYNQEKNNYLYDDFSKSFTTRNYGYAYKHMGSYYLKAEKYEVANEFFAKAQELLTDFPYELPSLQSKIAECYLGLKNYEKAIASANHNINLIKLNLFNKSKINNYKILEKIYYEKGDLNNLIKVKDSILLISKSGYDLNISNKMSDLETNIVLSKKRSEINKSRIMYNTYLFILIICFTILAFSLVSLRLNFNLEKEKSKKILNEKIIVENDLNHKKVELLNKSNFISQRNENLNYLLESVDYIESNTSNSSIQIKQKIKDLLRTENLNDRFEKHFEDVYPGFFKSLIRYSSKLTQNDLRFCAYLKMNQSTDEIAKLTSISIRTVESKKYRVKKKFKIGKDQSLTGFIHSI
jgi:tetratricopeptide (TPR) repeat protein/DNA-binding CsgD family transcriptional regulator